MKTTIPSVEERAERAFARMKEMAPPGFFDDMPAEQIAQVKADLLHAERLLDRWKIGRC